MTKSELKPNKMYYSTRYKCWGQCLNVKDFMAFMIWSHPTAQMGWYPCTELECDFSKIKP